MSSTTSDPALAYRRSVLQAMGYHPLRLRGHRASPSAEGSLRLHSEQGRISDGAPLLRAILALLDEGQAIWRDDDVLLPLTLDGQPRVSLERLRRDAGLKRQLWMAIRGLRRARMRVAGV